MEPTCARSLESCIVKAPIANIWDLLKHLRFDKLFPKYVDFVEFGKETGLD